MIRSAGSPSRFAFQDRTLEAQAAHRAFSPETGRRINRSLALSPPAHHRQPSGQADSLRSHAYRAIEADGLAVEHWQFENILHQLGEFLRPAESLRKGTCLPRESWMSCGICSTIAVWKVPGAIATQRMPNLANSRAIGRVIPATAALVAA